MLRDDAPPDTQEASPEGIDVHDLAVPAYLDPVALLAQDEAPRAGELLGDARAKAAHASVQTDPEGPERTLRMTYSEFAQARATWSRTRRHDGTDDARLRRIAAPLLQQQAAIAAAEDVAAASATRETSS